jgi:hypothetical protein
VFTPKTTSRSLGYTDRFELGFIVSGLRCGPAFVTGIFHVLNACVFQGHSSSWLGLGVRWDEQIAGSLRLIWGSFEEAHAITMDKCALRGWRSAGSLLSQASSRKTKFSGADFTVSIFPGNLGSPPLRRRTLTAGCTAFYMTGCGHDFWTTKARLARPMNLTQLTTRGFRDITGRRQRGRLHHDPAHATTGLCSQGNQPPSLWIPAGRTGGPITCRR